MTAIANPTRTTIPCPDCGGTSFYATIFATVTINPYRWDDDGETDYEFGTDIETDELTAITCADPACGWSGSFEELSFDPEAEEKSECRKCHRSVLTEETTWINQYAEYCNPCYVEHAAAGGGKL